MTREVPEWIGATADSPIPVRVKLRIFERHKGICHISGRKIMPGDAFDYDHVIALVNWTGEGHGNRESNIAPALRDKHKLKTAADVAEKSRVRKIKAKHLGLQKAKHKIPGSKGTRWKKKLDGSVVPR